MINFYKFMTFQKLPLTPDPLDDKVLAGILWVTIISMGVVACV